MLANKAVITVAVNDTLMTALVLLSQVFDAKISAFGESQKNKVNHAAYDLLNLDPHEVIIVVDTEGFGNSDNQSKR